MTAIILVPTLVITLISIKILTRKKIQVYKITKGTIIEAVYGIGTVTANKSFVFKVAVPSNVRELMVKEGDLVKKGDPLILLEETPLFRAPFQGTITSIQYKPGETVTSNSTILTMADMKDRYLLVSMEQQGAVRIHVGQSARLNFESFRDKTFEGKVEAIFANQGQFYARISADNLPAEILPGMTVDVAIQISKKENVLLGPVAGLTNGILSKKVGNGSVLVPVKTGIIDADQFEILSGDIHENDEVVIHGAELK